MSEPTREILNFYKNELAARPAVEQWRKSIPDDVRRAWIRYMVGTAGADKLTEPGFVHIVVDRLPPNTKETFDYLHSELARLEELVVKGEAGEFVDEATFDRLLELDQLLQDNVTEPMLQEFARLYFQSFEVDALKIQEQRERAQAVGERMVTALTPLLTNIRSTAEHMWDQNVLVNYNPAIWNQVQDVDQRHLLKAVVLTGSGAIGPRSADYPRHPDFDLYVIPEAPTADNKAALSMFQAIVDSLSHLTKRLQGETSEAERLLMQRKLDLVAPGWNEMLTVAQPEEIDLYVPEAATASSQYLNDWRKLTGPHMVVATATDDWQIAYAYYCENAIQQAEAFIAASRQPKG